MKGFVSSREPPDREIGVPAGGGLERVVPGRPGLCVCPDQHTVVRREQILMGEQPLGPIPVQVTAEPPHHVVEPVGAEQAGGIRQLRLVVVLEGIVPPRLIVGLFAADPGLNAVGALGNRVPG